MLNAINKSFSALYPRRPLHLSVNSCPAELKSCSLATTVSLIQSTDAPLFTTVGLISVLKVATTPHQPGWICSTRSSTLHSAAGVNQSQVTSALVNFNFQWMHSVSCCMWSDLATGAESMHSFDRNQNSALFVPLKLNTRRNWVYNLIASNSGVIRVMNVCNMQPENFNLRFHDIIPYLSQGEVQTLLS